MSVAKILRLLALVLAVVGAFVAVPYVALGLIVLGLAIGFIGIEEERRMAYFVMAIALTMMAGTLGPVPMAGEYLTGILTNVSTVINAGAIAVILTIIYERVVE
jgi:hypothetical protein